MFEFVHERHQRGCFREPTVSRDKPMRFLFRPMGLCPFSSFFLFLLWGCSSFSGASLVESTLSNLRTGLGPSMSPEGDLGRCSSQSGVILSEWKKRVCCFLFKRGFYDVTYLKTWLLSFWLLPFD